MKTSSIIASRKPDSSGLKKRNERRSKLPLASRIFAAIFLTGLVGLGAPGCTPVKGYQKMYLNDPCMDLAPNKLDYFETNFHTYREGASGANGGKVGGGCGCN